MSPFPQTPEGFSPEMLDVLDRAFSAIWHELQASRSMAVPDNDQQTTRLVSAKSIIEQAVAGVRAPERIELEHLERDALHAAKQSRTRARARPVLHLPG